MRSYREGGEAVELPQDFRERMKQQLGSSYEDFIASYEKERTYGLRCNPLKINKNKLVSILTEQQIVLEPVPWAKEGFYYSADAQPGKLALHEAGAYYIQEPSAMAVVELLEPKPGEKILDLCAAPGGKSTQIAGWMQGKGLLASNEIVSSRSKILSRNIERMGITNALVLNETPEHLAERFPVFFDRIVVDAPCSGEGMFRKNAQAIEEWSLQQVAVCAGRQKDILSCAVKMLKPGGILVYSTCTFAPQENEETVEWLTTEYAELVLEKSMHIWPHLQKGEGHFAARFRKKGPVFKEGSAAAGEKTYRRPAKVKESYRLLLEFLQEVLAEESACFLAKGIPIERLVLFGEYLYLIPDGIVYLDGLKVERAGLQLGRCRKDRFEPSHALAMALRPEQVRQTVELSEPERYLRGETVICGGQNGWTLVTVQGCSIGWGKAVQGVLKNHYPKGLRIM